MLNTNLNRSKTQVEITKNPPKLILNPTMSKPWDHLEITTSSGAK